MNMRKKTKKSWKKIEELSKEALGILKMEKEQKEVNLN